MSKAVEFLHKVGVFYVATDDDGAPGAPLWRRHGL
jgi:uncharacterized pyridoxamine 5'-phosphate oxidase family protein